MQPLLNMVITTCDSQAAAEKIASTLVQESLAACVSILPGVLSFYQWQGQLQREKELVLLIKCPPESYAVLEQRLQEIHPYDVPEIIALPVVKGLPAYLNWVNEQSELDINDKT